MEQIATPKAWVLDITIVETLLDELQIREEVIDYVKEASRQVAHCWHSVRTSRCAITP